MHVFQHNRVCKLFGISYPIIQAGMVWVSGAKLAAASANAGCLGVIGAGSMKPDLLAYHIKKAKDLTDKSLAVNVPLLYKYTDEQIETALEEGIRIFITSAGSPRKYTDSLKKAGCLVAHVVSSPLLAMKCMDAGVDAVIAEGFEAGGHNGRDELTTFTLIPQTTDAVSIPVIAAGGIGDGRGIAAAFALGAEGVQLGTRFLATKESSAHPNFKKAVIDASPTDTVLCMKELVPVRLLKNKFYQQLEAIERNPAHTRDDLSQLLGKGRAKLGMLDGNLDEGELEVGQISGLIKDEPSVAEMVDKLIYDYLHTIKKLQTNS